VQLAQLANRIRRPGPVVIVATLLLASLLVAGAWLYSHDHFAPIFDLAMTEMRVRDVGTAHTPLIGLPGRLGRNGGASHPGPLSFFLLAPVYRLLGGSYWALRMASLVLHATAIVSSLVIARRRAGARGVVGIGVSIAVLEAGFGLILLTEPWNPNLPVLWFLVFLMSVWSVAADDPWLLPVAAFAGCFCAQTHIPYLAVCGGLTPIALIAWAASWKRARQRGSAGKDHWRSLLVALLVVVILWTPPVVEEVRARPGNLWLLFDYFSRSPAKLVGFRAAVRLVVSHLDAWQLIVDSVREPGILSNAAMHERQPDAERGFVVLALWAASALGARRAGGRELTSLNGVLAMALGVEVLAISRIIGAPWHYLLYSCWVVSGALLFATVWGLLALSSVTRRLSEARALYAGAAIIAPFAVRLALSVVDAGSSTPVASAQLADLASQTVTAIFKHGREKADGTYLITWYDPIYGGAQGIGLVNEFERSGLRALATREYGTLVTSHRVGSLLDATSLVMLAGGDWVIDASYISGARRVAYSDLRDIGARKEFDASRVMLVTALTQLGRGDIVAKLGRRLSDVGLVKGLHPFLRMTLNRMIEIGVPAAVFVLPLQALTRAPPIPQPDRPGGR